VLIGLHVLAYLTRVETFMASLPVNEMKEAVALLAGRS
jgi:hypothetical protein